MKRVVCVLIGLMFSFALYANGIEVRTRTVSESNDGPKYTIEAKYPEIIGKNLSGSEHQFNAIAKKSVQDRIAVFKKSVKEIDNNRVPQELREKGSDLKINYQLTKIEPKKLLSLRNHIEYNIVGAAHPNQEFSSINYDLNNNKQLTLSDLFKSNATYLERMATYSESKLRPKLGDSMFKEGLAPILKNYSVWNVTPKGLNITFNNYQVAPYVYGPQEVLIPYHIFEGALKEQSVLKDCVKNKEKCQIQ